jgi:hypothetical protein
MKREIYKKYIKSSIIFSYLNLRILLFRNDMKKVIIYLITSMISTFTTLADMNIGFAYIYIHYQNSN